jgi:hypothetical protein
MVRSLFEVWIRPTDGNARSARREAPLPGGMKTYCAKRSDADEQRRGQQEATSPVVICVSQGRDGDRQADNQHHESADREASHRCTSGRSSYSVSEAGAWIDDASAAFGHHSTKGAVS